jgi:hypothetical protein
MEITINEAIRILSDTAYAGVTTHDEKFNAAAGLGAEALKEIRDQQADPAGYFKDLLPGQKAEP